MLHYSKKVALAEFWFWLGGDPRLELRREAGHWIEDQLSKLL